MTRRLGRLLASLRRPDLLLLVAAVTVVAYAATNVGELSPDPETRYQVAESIVREGDLALADNGLTAAADDGTHYSVFFPGQTITFLPLAAVMEAARRIVGGDPGTWLRLGDFIAAMLLVPLIAAAAALGHAALLGTLGLGRRAAAASALVLALGTAQWVWATAGSEEVSLGAAAVWAMWFGLRGIGRLPELTAASAAAPAGDPADAARIRRSIITALGLGGVLVAVGLIHRGTAIAAAAGYVALTVPPLLARQHRSHLPRIAVGLVPWVLLAAAIVAIVPLYNLARFGDPMDSGYGRFYGAMGGLWATALLEGLGGHLVSPGKSVFLYTPWLLLLLPAVTSGRVRRRLGPLGPAILVATLVHLVLYSKTTFWAGAFGFGVRFHVCMLPLLLVPIAAWWWGRPAAPSPVARIAVTAVLTASVTVQVLGLALNTGYEYLADRSAYDPQESRIPRAAAWDPARSPLRIRTEAVLRLMGGQDILPPGEPESKRIQATWNVFPVRAQVMLGDGPRTRALWLLWSGLMIALAAVLLVLAARLRHEPRTTNRLQEPDA